MISYVARVRQTLSPTEDPLSHTSDVNTHLGLSVEALEDLYDGRRIVPLQHRRAVQDERLFRRLEGLAEGVLRGTSPK